MRASECKACGEVLPVCDLGPGGQCSACSLSVPAAIVRARGAWEPPSEAERLRARAFFAEMRAAGIMR